MTTLLLAKHDNHALNDATSKALTAAKALGAPVHVLVAGTGCRGVAEAAAKLDGVEKVLVADDPAYEHRLAEPLAALIVSLAQPYDHLVAPGTTTGKNVMPRVAALLDVMQVSDIIKVVGPDTFQRPIYAGNAIQTVQAIDGRKAITVRTAAFQPVGEGTQPPRSRSPRGCQSECIDVQRRGAVQIGSTRVGFRKGCHLRWSRAWLDGELQNVHRAGC